MKKIFKGSLKTQHCDYLVQMVGENEIEAIKDYFLRKEEVSEVLAISEDSAGNTKGYSIEHSGRPVKVYANYTSYEETQYSDYIHSIKEIENLI